MSKSFVQPEYTQADPQILQRNPWNPNQVAPDNQDKIRASIQQLGMFKPIVVRTLADGSLEILAGEHRNDAAMDLGWDRVDIVNLGEIDDEKAKQISLIDNKQYGDDDDEAYAAVLRELNLDDFRGLMRVDDDELQALMEITDAHIEVDLDDLDGAGGDDLETPDVPDSAPATRTHQILRYKVPIDDAVAITDLINKIRTQQGFNDADELTNSGDALVYLARQARDKVEAP